PTVSGLGVKGRKAKFATSCRNAFMTNVLLLAGLGAINNVGPRLKPCPRQSRHCESVLLEQMSPLSCYEVKASVCSESHSQAEITVRISHPLLTYEID